MNSQYLSSIEFIHIPQQLSLHDGKKGYSRAGTIRATTDFIYKDGFKNKKDIQLVKDAFGLIRRTGIHEKIAASEDYFPEKLRVVYSLAEIEDNVNPKIDISPLEEDIIWSCLGNLNKSNKIYPTPKIIEARPDAIDLDYGFLNLTLRFSPTEEQKLLNWNGGVRREEQCLP